MKDLFLKFDDMQSACDLLILSGFVPNELGEFEIDGACVDIIGSMFNKDESDPDNIILTPVDGYYINIRVVKETEFPLLDEFRVYPETPFRVWA